jgi:hypothetical protein
MLPSFRGVIGFLLFLEVFFAFMPLFDLDVLASVWGMAKLTDEDRTQHNALIKWHCGTLFGWALSTQTVLQFGAGTTARRAAAWSQMAGQILHVIAMIGTASAWAARGWDPMLWYGNAGQVVVLVTLIAIGLRNNGPHDRDEPEFPATGAQKGFLYFMAVWSGFWGCLFQVAPEFVTTDLFGLPPFAERTLIDAYCRLWGGTQVGIAVLLFLVAADGEAASRLLRQFPLFLAPGLAANITNFEAANVYGFSADVTRNAMFGTGSTLVFMIVGFVLGAGSAGSRGAKAKNH